MNVTLRQLRVFRAVAAGRNFSRAGDQIGLTQPAVSRSIFELEAQLGLKLLDRTTRDVALTEAGQSLAARLDRLLDELDLTLLDMKGMASARRGTVRVASSPTLSAHLLPACIAECARRDPEIRFELLDRIQRDVLGSVRAGEVDFGVVIEPAAADDLLCETILSDPFCLIVPEAHALARQRSVRWSALNGETLVLLDHASGSRRLIDHALARLGAQCSIAQEVGHPTTVLHMVATGLGISVLPRMALPPRALHGIAVCTLTPRVQRDIVLVHRAHRSPGPLAQRVWDLVREMAAAYSKATPPKAP